MAQWRDKIVDAFNRLTLLLFASECPQPAKPRDPTFQKLKLKHVEAALWGGFAEHAAHELHWRVHSRKNRSQAAWVLARWSAAEARYRDCLNYLKFHRPTNSNANTRAWLLHADALSRCDIHEQAEMVGAQLLSHRQGGQDANLLYAAIAPEAERLGRINKIYEASGLAQVRPRNESARATLDNLVASAGTVGSDLKVSIVVPAYNAEATLPAALRSILGQSWENLEVLVVDDASTDNTKSVIETFAMEDPRIFPLWHEENRGAYASRNTGLRAATGDYFTVHDSDDWSHPEKIAIQVRHLQNHPLCTTMGARLTNDLRIAVRPEGPRIDFENISSLMAPTSYFRELGGWDEIRGGADSEFYERLLKSRGAQRSMVMPDTPLTLIRSAEGSLTRQNATGLQTLRYGARREYVESYRAWHQTATSLTFQSGDRPFPVPPILLRNSNSRQYDAIYVLDFAVGAPVIPLMSAAINKGKSIAVVNWPTPATSGEKADPRLRAFLRTHMMDTIVAGDDATADEIIFAHRRLLDYPPKPLASLSGRRSFLS